MQAIILLGGKGTRLSRLFPDRPKALVLVAGKPFLERQLAWLNSGGVTDIHLASGHMAGAILEWVQNHSPNNITVTCSIEPAPLDTGGGLKFTEQHIHSNPFLVLNGDSLLPNMDIAALEQAHAQAHPLVTIAVTRIRETGRYGTIEFDKENRILAFHEKAERQYGWVNGGAYLMDRKALAMIEPGKSVSLETEVFPQLAAQGQLRAFPVPSPLLDMGTPEGLAAMERYFSRQACPP